MKKLFYPIVFLLGLSITIPTICYAQEENSFRNQEVFTIVEEMPDFYGGMAELANYLARNIKYPQEALAKGIQGRVFVNFIVEPDGSVSNVNVMRSLGGGCDEEAVRVVKSMPKWKPGRQDGKAVRVSYILPVNFQCKNNGGNTFNGHDYVDLGLPSGTLWATCNVGANAPEEYGDYFAWGETQPKDTYVGSNYKYSNGYYFNDLIKYCNKSEYGDNGFSDNLTVLQPMDDAATVNFGSGWCMPTSAQWEELMNNTTETWTTQNGVNGRLFTASNGNSLFLPAAGSRCYSDLYVAGSYGFYWSSTLKTDDPNDPNLAWYFFFYSGDYYMYGDYRYLGFSVRPVCSSRQN